VAKEIDTEKVKRIVAEAVQLHRAECPAVKAVADALQSHKEETTAAISGLRNDLRDQHEENLKAYHETEKQLIKGDAEFKSHEQRLGAVENVTRHITNEIEAHKQSVSNAKTKVIVGLLKVVVYLAVGGGGTAAILQALGLF